MQPRTTTLSTGSLAPFADDCVRRENGAQSARNPVPMDAGQAQGFGVIGSLGCAAQIDTNFFEHITSIENRRVWIAMHCMVSSKAKPNSP
jgi:hypothetical protein